MHMDEQNKYLRSCRIVKHKGNTVALKLIVRSSEMNELTSDDFWPTGVFARKWIEKDVPTSNSTNG